MRSLLRIATSIMVLTAASFAGVTVSSPANGSTVTSPTHFVASASSSYPITAMRIYVDYVSKYATSTNKIDTYLTLPAGSHSVVIQAWDSTGAVFKAPLTLTVASSGGTTIPSTAKTYSKIEEMTGWQSCTVCAGIGANGPVAQYSMTQFISNPSMDGRSAQFWIGGSTPYSDALWWKQLGGNSAPRHFVYDLYFYIKTPQVAEALEFDVNHSVGGKKYIMGVQCDIKSSHQWDVWDGGAKKWAPTGISCPAPPAYQWNHLVEEFYHDNTGKVTFVAITLNGVKHYVNRTYWSQPSGVSEVNVAFQMDGDYKQTPYSTWLDQVKLTYW